MLYKQPKSTTAMLYGIQNESNAIKELSNIIGKEIRQVGFIIDETNPFLGATPDGLVKEDGLVEIKCPYSIMDATPEEAINNKTIRWATLQNNKLKLNKNHKYFYQVQGQLHISRKEYCLFTIWSPKGIIFEKIERDDDFFETFMRKKLENFYYKCVLP